jgi:hypothetical protein
MREVIFISRYIKTKIKSKSFIKNSRNYLRRQVAVKLKLTFLKLSKISIENDRERREKEREIMFIFIWKIILYVLLGKNKNSTLIIIDTVLLNVCIIK